MKCDLVFIHGRAQENLNPDELKSEWISAWAEGLKSSDLTIPLAPHEVRFPYYGQALYHLATGVAEDKVASVIVRGDASNSPREVFIREVLEEARKAAEVSDAEVQACIEENELPHGALNWPWVRAILKVIDRHIPGASGASIALATSDVYDYLRNIGIRDAIETGVRNAIKPKTPTVLVSHSLGTVVAYNLLKREGASLGWKVPLFVTLGSPLAVTAIKRSLHPIAFPSCVERWYNAFDPCDIVALYPLNRTHFGVSPDIYNNEKVKNETENRHGISGYLSNKEVARRIYDAVT